ncbi:MAG: aminotransferase class III-fold pyridoxal phosphate-dependent enzyme, partial [Leuconostoc gelidum]
VYTTAGNPVTAAAALATLDVIEEEQLVARSEKLGLLAQEFFEQAAQRYTFIGDVRLYGLNGGIDIIDSSGMPDNVATTKLIYRIFELGAIMISLRGNTLRFQPPLVITEKQLTHAFNIIEQAFSELAHGYLTLPETDNHIGW